MRNTIITCIEKFYLDPITQIFNRFQYLLSVIIKLRVKKTPYILYHHSTGMNFTDKTNCFRKQISFIIFTQLLTCNRKRGAGNTTCKQINPLIGSAIKIVNVCTYDIPLWTISFQYFTVILLILYQDLMSKPCHCQSKSLTTCTSTDFYGC